MALRPCEDCKHAIRSEDRICPHCGAKQPGGSRSQLGKFALILFAMGFGVWVFDATSGGEPEKKLSAAASATAPAEARSPMRAPVAQLSEHERLLQDRCGPQTDENGNWLVKGAETRARCRVQVELELEREQRAASPSAVAANPPVRETAPPLHAVRPANQVSRPRSRARVRHDAAPRVVPAPVAPVSAAINAVSEPERERPTPREDKGLNPGDDLQPLVPVGGGLLKDPVPGEPMTVKPDAAFL